MSLRARARGGGICGSFFPPSIYFIFLGLVTAELLTNPSLIGSAISNSLSDRSRHFIWSLWLVQLFKWSLWLPDWSSYFQWPSIMRIRITTADLVLVLSLKNHVCETWLDNLILNCCANLPNNWQMCKFSKYCRFVYCTVSFLLDTGKSWLDDPCDAYKLYRYSLRR